jgi:MFS family permease
LRLAGFRLLFLSTLGSSFGTLLAAVALAIDVKDRTNSGPWVGAVLLVEVLPTVAVGLLFGPLLDRLERRRLMVVADLVRAGVFFALPFTTSAAQIVALAGIAGLATGFFRPAVYAGVPNLVPDEVLPDANAILQTVENISWTVGPIVGGVLASAAGPHLAYWINGVSFLVSAALVWRIPARLLQSEAALTRGHWRDLADGFVAVLRSRPLLAVLVAWGLASLGIGGANVAEVFLAKNTFHAGDWGYGLLYGAIGGGLVLGSFASSWVIPRLGTTRAYVAGLLAMAVGFAGAAASPNVWVAAACCVAGGLGDGTAIACNALLVQRGAADAVRGRALTLVMSATYVALGVGNAVTGVVLHASGPRWVWAGAAGMFVLAAVAGLVLAREPRQRPVPLEVGAD